MEKQTQNKPKEFTSHEDKPLSEVWEGEVVISLSNVKSLLQAFKQEGIKDKNGLLYRLSVVGQIGMQERLTVTSPVTLGW